MKKYYKKEERGVINLRENKLKRVKLGDSLIMRGLITQEQLEEAVAYQKEHNVKIGKALVKLGYLEEIKLLGVFAESMRMEIKTIDEIQIDSYALDMIPQEIIKKHKFFPIEGEEENISIIVNNPYNISMEEELKAIMGKEVKMYLALERDIEKLIGEAFDKEEEMNSLKEFDSLEDNGIDMYDVTQNKDASAIVNMVNKIMEEAYNKRASDIHIEPREDKLIVRNRIDGVLFEVKEYPKKVHQPLIARIKMMANLDISEKRKPQDGRIQFKIKDKDVDARISVLSTINGEKITLRILDRNNVVMSVDNLGISDKQLKKFRRMIDKPSGVILVTGPTGSGKTSTLYTILNEENDIAKNIVTVEDPVEYKLDGINQVNINEAGGITFPLTLRAILRQDPDIILVGEIRDNETADIATKAATTGHKVYTTLHTDKAADAIGRLGNMGIEDHLIGTTLNGVISQRLVRRVCDECKELYELEEDDIERMYFKLPVGEKYYRATGKTKEGKTCPNCQGIGYKGRIAVHEILEMDNVLRKHLSENGFDYSFEEKAIEQGMFTLTRDALDKAKEGISTLEEVKRVIGANYGE